MQRWESIVIISLLVFGVLYVFQPFGINYIRPDKKLSVLLGYAIVTAMVMVIQNCLFPFIFPRYFDEKNWTVGKHIVNHMVTMLFIAMANVGYGYVFHITWQEFNGSVFISALLIVISVGIVPIAIVTILNQNRMLKTSLREAVLINNSLPVFHEKPKPESVNIVLSGTGKEALEVEVNQLLYMEACGNYIKVNYLKNGKPVQKMLRATIKQMEKDTAGYPSILKCHRAFLIRVDAIKQVLGNSQGYQLVIDGIDKTIPVSRAFTRAVKQRFLDTGL
jgi:DNA-binding LytR/AlgR family response regulator